MKSSHVALMNPKEAAVLLRLSPITLAKMRVTGRGPRFRKLGGRVFYAEADIDAWVESCARHSTADPGPAEPLASAVRR